MESDFVLVFPSTIVAMECKTSLDCNPLRDASAQWERLLKVLQEEVGVDGADFRFVRVLCYEKIANDSRYQDCETCPNCSAYLLKFGEDDGGQDAFLSKFRTLLPEVDAPAEETKFFNLVRDLLIFTSPRGGGDLGDRMESRLADAFGTRHAQFVGTPAMTAFFWSPQQYEVLNQKLVVFQSGRWERERGDLRIVSTRFF